LKKGKTVVLPGLTAMNLPARLSRGVAKKKERTFLQNPETEIDDLTAWSREKNLPLEGTRAAILKKKKETPQRKQCFGKTTEETAKSYKGRKKATAIAKEAIVKSEEKRRLKKYIDDRQGRTSVETNSRISPRSVKRSKEANCTIGKHNQWCGKRERCGGGH